MTRLEDGLDLTESGRPVRLDLVIKEMTDADQDELVMSSKLLLDRARELERSLASKQSRRRRGVGARRALSLKLKEISEHAPGMGLIAGPTVTLGLLISAETVNKARAKII